MVPEPLIGSGKAAAVRDTATTGAPASARAVAIPWPSPRLAPTTIVVLPDSSLMVSSSSRVFSSVPCTGRRGRLQLVVRCFPRPAEQDERERHPDPGQNDAGHEGGLEALGQDGEW